MCAQALHSTVHALPHASHPPHHCVNHACGPAYLAPTLYPSHNTPPHLVVQMVKEAAHSQQLVECGGAHLGHHGLPCGPPLGALHVICRGRAVQERNDRDEAEEVNAIHVLRADQEIAYILKADRSTFEMRVGRKAHSDTTMFAHAGFHRAPWTSRCMTCRQSQICIFGCRLAGALAHAYIYVYIYVWHMHMHAHTPYSPPGTSWRRCCGAPCLGLKSWRW